MRIALLVVFLLLGCEEDKQAAGPPPRAQLPVMAPVAPKATPPTTAAPIGWWRSDGVCLELHENGDFELAVMSSSSPKVMFVGTATATRDGERWKLQLTPTKIWQARFIGKCRKTVISAKQLDKAQVLGAELKQGEPVSATLEIADTVTLCFGEKCATLVAQTPTLRGRWERPRTAAPGTMQTWPKDELVHIELAGPSYTWAVRTGTGEASLDSTYGDQDDSVTLVGPDHYEIEVGKRRFTATRLAGQRLELCETGKSCAMFERAFDTSRTDVPCRE